MAKRKRKVTLFDLSAIDFSTIKHDNPNFMQEYQRAESYLRESFKSKDFKKEAIIWIQKSSAKQAKTLSILEDWRFATVGKLCYFLNRDAHIIESGYQYIADKLDEFEILAKKQHALKKKTDKAKASVKKYTIQDYLRIKASNVAGEYFEQWIDEFIDDPDGFKAANYDPLSVMRANELSQGHVRYFIAMYEANIAEIRGFLAGRDAEYCQHTKPALKELLKLYENILSASQMIISTSVAARKPKQLRQIDISKQIAKLKYLKEFQELGLVSISPLKLIGAKEIWVYNTKTRKIGKYITFDDDGIGVKGTTLTNVSSDGCTQKNLRKPKEQIKNFTGGIRKMNNQFKSVKSIEITLKPRINENVILLAVFK